MQSNPSNFGATTPAGDGRVTHDAALMAEALEPRPIDRPAPPSATRPAVRVPRSAWRTYSPVEVSVAAGLLAKLRRRDDLRPLADHACGDPEHPLDVAVDRLLDLM